MFKLTIKNISVKLKESIFKKLFSKKKCVADVAIAVVAHVVVVAKNAAVVINVVAVKSAAVAINAAAVVHAVVDAAVVK